MRCAVQKTLYRNIFFSEDGIFHIAIPRTDLRNKVEFDVSCTALVDLANYNNPASHSDFNEFSFNIQKGEPLAIFESFDFNADIQYHKLKAASAFMTIIPNQTDSELTEYILDDNKIQIRLPREIYDTYKVLGKRKDFAPIIHASIVQNALTVALYNYEEHLENGKTWAEVIQYRLQHEHDLNNGSEKIDPNMIPELVQKILGSPDKRMINQLDTFFKTNFEEG